MQFSRISKQQAFDSLLERNRRFRSRRLELPGLYELLERHGYDCRHCVLVQVCPEGVGSYDATLLGPGGEWIEVEVSPGEPGETRLQVVAPAEPARQPSGDPREPASLARRYRRELLDG